MSFNRLLNPLWIGGQTPLRKTILKAFGLDDGYIKERVKRISERLRIADEIRIPGVD